VRRVNRKECENDMAACSICLGVLGLARCFGALGFLYHFMSTSLQYQNSTA
jgi:hypothetical protein